MPAAQINDDYCDCADGSDEPGTSACVNSRFYCRNIGAKGKSLPSSRVNDGVCDCCDGTDEIAAYSHVTCENTCQEAGRADRERMEREIASTEAGWTTRLTLIQKAAVSLNEKRAKMAHYTKIMNDRIVLKEAARQLKEAEEAVENTERARREAEKIKAEEEKKAAEAKAEADRAAAAGEAPAAAPASTPEGLVLADLTDAPVVPSATTTETASTIPAAATVTTEEAKPAAEENFPYPAEYAYKPADAAPAATEGEAAAASFPYPAEYAYNPDAPVAGNGEAEATGKIPAATTHSTQGGETVEPEYADDEHDQQGDDDDDDENEPDHSETTKEEEAEYVHPGQFNTHAACSPFFFPPFPCLLAAFLLFSPLGASSARRLTARVRRARAPCALCLQEDNNTHRHPLLHRRRRPSHKHPRPSAHWKQQLLH